MLRLANLSDIPELSKIEILTQYSPWTPETFEKCFQTQCDTWVISTDTTLIGFVIVLIQLDECHILNLGVTPDKQRQGYGSQLINQAFSEAKLKGASIVYLEVRHSNHNAIALYQKMGFTKIGERKGYYSSADGNEDAWVFMKHL